MADSPIPSPIRTAHVAGDGAFADAMRGVADSDVATLLLWPDAVVSPHCDSYVAAGLAASEDEILTAGVALALPRFRPTDGAPFVPLEDGSDGVYLRVDPFPGAAFTPQQARHYLAWLEAHPGGASPFVRYLTDTGRYLMTPRTPLAHDGGCGRTLQRAFPVGPRDWKLAPPGESLALYDADFEIAAEAAARLCPELAGLDLDIDLWGVKGDRATRPFLLSSRPCARPIHTLGLSLTPVEANLMGATSGAMFSLGRREDFAAPDKARHLALTRHVTRFSSLTDYAGQFLAPARRLFSGGAKQ